MEQIKKHEQFTGLYNQNFDYVYSYVFARTAGDGQLTEEIVQETFTAAWSSLDRFGYKSSYRTWLCSIAKNKLREYYRKAIYREQFELADDDDLTERADGFDLEKAVSDRETRQSVLRALNGIPTLYRYALIMKYIDNLSVKEIAPVLSRSPKAVDGLLQRAKVSFEKAFMRTEGHGRNER